MMSHSVNNDFQAPYMCEVLGQIQETQEWENQIWPCSWQEVISNQRLHTEGLMTRRSAGVTEQCEIFN